MSTFADIYMKCDEHATSMSFNGERRWPGESYRAYMNGEQSVEFMASCDYEDEVWYPGSRLSRSYDVKVIQPPPKMDYVVFNVASSGSDGLCHI